MVPRLRTAFTLPGLGTQYASVTLDDGYDFLVGPSTTAMALIAHEGESGVLSIRSSVPEPETWSLLVAGLGAVGAALRRRPLRRNFVIR